MPQVVLLNGTRFQADAGTSLLEAALAQGIVLEHSCRNGRCGACKAQVISGDVAVIGDASSLTDAEREAGFILTCATEACCDLHLSTEDLKALADIRLLTLPARIEALEMLAPEVLRVVLRLPPRADFRFVAGQYIDVIGPGGLRRSYSIASDPAVPEKLELQIRRVEGGALSAWWFGQAKVNDLLRFQGPRGTFYLRDLAEKSLIFLATGTGYAPIQAMLHQLASLPETVRPASIALYWGGRELPDLYLDPLRWSSHPALRYVPVLSRAGDDWSGACGHVQQFALTDNPDLANTMVYACGSSAMISSARTVFLQAGLPVANFHSDAFVSSTN